MKTSHTLITTIAALTVFCLGSANSLALTPPAPNDPVLPDDLAMGDDGVGGIESGVGTVVIEDGMPPLELVHENLLGECGGSTEVEPDTEPADVDWQSVGTGMPGTGALLPQLSAQGRLAPDERVTLRIRDARPSSVIILVVGDSAAQIPFMGGTLVPTPQFIIAGLPLDDTGRLEMDFRVTDDLPDELTLITQAWILDPEAAEGYAATNAVSVSTEP